LNKVIIQVSIA